MHLFEISKPGYGPTHAAGLVVPNFRQEHLLILRDKSEIHQCIFVAPFQVDDSLAVFWLSIGQNDLTVSVLS